MIIGIIGAMKEEIILLKNELQKVEEHKMGAREFYSGYLGHTKIVMCLSGWGKAAAASTTTTLINHFGVNQLVFIGLAGALQAELSIGDIVISNQLVQHDFDLKDFSDLGNIQPPFYKEYSFPVPATSVQICQNAANEFVENISAGKYSNIDSSYAPKIYVGSIGTGDQFVGSEAKKKNILSKYPNLLCTEMEGGAIAQIACDYGISYSIIRVISDNASDTGHQDFVRFLFNNISNISVEFIKTLVPKLS